MKVLVTGSEGQLGRKLVDLLSAGARFDVTAADRVTLDITREADVRALVSAVRPDWILSCAAYTDVERAESEPEKAFLVNDTAVGYLADSAALCGARLFHVSTDYVFSGDFHGASRRPYHEDDVPAPLSRYGASKLAGETRLRNHPVRSAIFRTSWLYGGPGRNFLHTMLRVGEESRKAGRPVRVVDDQIGTPTDAWSLAEQICRLLGEDVEGLFHASAEGEASWFDFTREIYRLAGIHVATEPIRTADYPTKARRPPYSVLENRRLGTLGLDVLPPWREGLEKAWRRLRR